MLVLSVEEGQDLRTTTSQPRLNHMMALSIYKELVNELDLYAVANDFVHSSKHRLGLFGTSTVCDK